MICVVRNPQPMDSGGFLTPPQQHVILFPGWLRSK
jgi:hypothetical protein